MYYKTRKIVFDYISKTEKSAENMTRSGVFLINFEVCRNMFKRCFECLIDLLNRN